MTMSDNKNTILSDSGLVILTTSDGFMFGCCDCGAIHRVVIEKGAGNAVLKLHRIVKDDERQIDDISCSKV